MCAFLRGVNVGGKNMKMAEVCDVFRRDAIHKVCSILATGNILFESSLAKADLRVILEKDLSEHYKTEAYLFIKDEVEIEGILSSSPFLPNPDLQIYTFICEDGFEEELMDRFSLVTPVANERAQVKGGQFYWQVSKGATLDSGFSKILGEKQLKDKFTSRNINTIQKIFNRIVTL